MSRITQGPWVKDRSGNIYGKDRRFVCSANGSMSNVDWEDHQAENDANGNMILAAPEMYEALKSAFELISCMPMGDITLEKISDALAKAEGK